MTDTIPIQLENDEIAYHIPFLPMILMIFGDIRTDKYVCNQIVDTKKGIVIHCHFFTK